MLQEIDGHEVYVVDLKTVPELPVTGLGVEGVYAAALTGAIENGIITEPGKYGIEVYKDNTKYRIARIFE